MPRKSGVKERIAVLSDGTCETAENLVRAILSQFQRANSSLTRLPKLREAEDILLALDSLTPPYLVVYTFGTENLRKLVWTEIKKRGLTGVDLLYPALDIFSEFLKSSPDERQASYHSTDQMNYFDRMEAIEYTVKHDDGQKLNDLTEADIVLTGVSRTSKTPTSMYLAHKGYKVANVPLVPGVEIPRGLLDAHAQHIPIIMLTIAPDALERIRKTRFEKLGSSPKQTNMYINPSRIGEELHDALALARRYKWPVIDVTSKAIEETASEILLIVSSKDL